MTRSVSFGLVFAAIVVAALILGFCSSTKNGTDTAAPGQGSMVAPSVATGASSPSEPATAPASTSESGDGTATAPEVIAAADTGATAGATGEAPSLTTSPTVSAEASISAPAVPNTGTEAATAAPSEVAPPAAESAADATGSTATAAVEDLTAAATESAGNATGAAPAEAVDGASATTSTTATAAADGTATTVTPPAAEDASTAPQSPSISVVTVVPAETQQAALPPEDANGNAAAPAVQEPVRPSFDVVRVDPSGNLVLAGRGAPGVEIVVTSDGQVVGTVTSDAKGEWVIVPTAPMAPGNHQLALTQKQQDGKVIGADKLVMIAVPERGKNVAGEAATADEGSLVVMVPSDDSGGAVVLQNPTQQPAKPAEIAAAESDGIASGALVLDAVDYDDKGAVTIGGRGTVGAAVRIYLDNQLIGSSTVDASGRWQVTPTSPVEPRLHTLRVDQIAPDGKVAERVESPFLRAERIDFPADQAFIVQPGNSLWRIARRTYGEGVRYTTIYQANSEQIRDPDLIYPGQVFSIPPQAQTN